LPQRTVVDVDRPLPEQLADVIGFFPWPFPEAINFVERTKNANKPITDHGA
jgi:hypothetical protein